MCPIGRLFKRASIQRSNIQTSPREWKLLPPADFPSLWGHSGSKKHQELTFIFAWVRTSLADIKSRKEAKTKNNLLEFLGSVSRGANIFCRTLHLVWAAGSQPRESNQEVRGIRGDGWTYPKFGISATNNTHRNLAILGHWDLVLQANAYDEEKKQCKPQSCSAVIPSCGKVTALVGSRRGKPSFPRSEQPMESIHSRKRNVKKYVK